MKRILAIRTGWSTPGRKPNEINGVDYYRIVLPAMAINKYSKKYHIDIKGDLTEGKKIPVKEFWDKIFIKWNYDGMIVKNLDQPDAVAQLLGARDYYKRKVVVDIDDNYNAIDPSSPVYPLYYKGSPACHATNTLIKHSDGFWVENEYLYHAYKKVKYPDVLHNYIDRKSLEKPFKKKKGTIRIGWMGGATHSKDMASIMPVLKDILEKHDVKFVIMGGALVNVGMLPKDKVEIVKFKLDYFDYLKLLPKLNIHIGVIPLVDSKFNECKSPCKFFEYSIAGISAVAIGLPKLPYVRAILNNETGLLFKTNKELYDKLETLIMNKELRENLVQKARADLSYQFSIQDHWQEWETALDKVFGG